MDGRREFLAEIEHVIVSVTTLPQSNCLPQATAMARRRQNVAFPTSHHAVVERDRQHADAWASLDRVQVLGDEIRDDGHSGYMSFPS